MSETALSGSDIKISVEALVDDSIDTDVFLALGNSAKDEIEGMLNLPGLVKTDSSQSALSGDNYQSFKALPADFAEVLPPYFIIVDTVLYRQIPIEKARENKDTPNVYYIDYANSQYALCGKVSSTKTIYMPYLATSSEWTSGTLGSVTPAWRKKYHNFCVFRIAELYQAGTQADDISVRQSGRWAREAERIKNDIMQWVARVQIANMNGTAEAEQGSLDLGASYPGNDSNLGDY